MVHILTAGPGLETALWAPSKYFSPSPTKFCLDPKQWCAPPIQ